MLAGTLSISTPLPGSGVTPTISTVGKVSKVAEPPPAAAGTGDAAAASRAVVCAGAGRPDTKAPPLADWALEPFAAPVGDRVCAIAGRGDNRIRPAKRRPARPISTTPPPLALVTKCLYITA